MRPALTEKQRRHRHATSQAMKRVAAARRCPACERQNAVTRINVAGKGVWPAIWFERCRYCGWDTEKMPTP